MIPRREAVEVVLQIGEQLLAYGADPNVPDQYGETILSLLQGMRSKRPDLIALVRQAGATVPPEDRFIQDLREMSHLKRARRSLDNQNDMPHYTDGQ